jgi:DNA-binding transcriptional LysR family regulator
MAMIAIAAGKIDFSDNPLVDERLRPLNDAAHELMAGHAREPHIAFEDLQIGGADSRQVNSDERALSIANGRAVAGSKF